VLGYEQVLSDLQEFALVDIAPVRRRRQVAVPYGDHEAEFASDLSAPVEPVFVHVGMLAHAIPGDAEIDRVAGIRHAQKMIGAAAQRYAFHDQQGGVLRP